LDVHPALDFCIKLVDQCFLGGVEGLTYILPNYLRFDTSNFVANGYNIYGDLVAEHLTMALVYSVTAGIVAYFFLKTREVAG
jgi:hypothetical protein